MLVGAIYATNNNHEITDILMGIIAGDAAGHAFGLVVQKIIQWMNRTNNMSNTGGASNGRNYSGNGISLISIRLLQVIFEVTLK